ncbi:hypothetical protein HHX47_DHR10000224 [Lentinula edodes]|nr:hypothetical protein HHX47_DHR10000224 [Lentinula edodes]
MELGVEARTTQVSEFLKVIFHCLFMLFNRRITGVKSSRPKFGIGLMYPHLVSSLIFLL